MRFEYFHELIEHLMEEHNIDIEVGLKHHEKYKLGRVHHNHLVYCLNCNTYDQD